MILISYVPLSDADRVTLAAYVARVWPEHARAQGLPRPRQAALLINGTLPPCDREVPTLRALESLARALEDLGYAIDRRGSARVVTGWATIDGRRVVDLDPGPVLTAYTNRLFGERWERDRPEREKASDPRGPKVLHAMRVDRRAAGGR